MLETILYQLLHFILEWREEAASQVSGKDEVRAELLQEPELVFEVDL